MMTSLSVFSEVCRFVVGEYDSSKSYPAGTLCWKDRFKMDLGAWNHLQNWSYIVESQAFGN